jgi:hypothetical protein
MPPSKSANGTLRHPNSPPAASMLTDPGSPGPPALPVWIKQKKLLIEVRENKRIREREYQPGFDRTCLEFRKSNSEIFTKTSGYLHEKLARNVTFNENSYKKIKV